MFFNKLLLNYLLNRQQKKNFFFVIYFLLLIEKIFLQTKISEKPSLKLIYQKSVLNFLKVNNRFTLQSK